ncbi:MAG TPA: phosphoribosylglycinamide formyltransferase [Bacteroidota bacterium]|nr:phosphoribosylglycinamide formyltransferase [Bacteroidota bacterium]
MNVAVFASGRGSNFQAILHAIDAGIVPAHVVVLISNSATAGAMETARAHGIPAVHISEKQFTNSEDFSNRMLAVLHEHHVEAIALAGYLKRVPPQVIQQFQNRILNIHPALLPFFGGAGMYGHHVHEAVIASGMKISGATVHLVNEEYDRGAILIQRTVEVTSADSAESLAGKVLTIEHEIFPLALKALAEHKVKIEGPKAWIMP